MSEERKEIRRGRYNMDFDQKKGNPYGNFQTACSHIDELKKKEMAVMVSNTRQ